MITINTSIDLAWLARGNRIDACILHHVYAVDCVVNCV